ncbi:dihydroorotate dehydrogenase [candidate division WS5 bacterium]|uniref:Dihydroorotate dehydrogenase n=1 Tax=candidate division WS5 bacterium TaxID=2093353 RepID=A0A419DGP5_9BACT|nr:MAG: dihydroorotate dehydrogenase [candidate division WS5 bacterium]
MSYEFLGKKISGTFTVPSGILTTDLKVLENVAETIPEIGVLTTKSIGLETREGNREPIITQYAPGCFMNAVGLTNPGAEVFAEGLKNLNLPKDRFLLTSIFGGNKDEFVKVAKILAPYSDGLELNLSCPHAKGYGMAIGQDPEMVYEITKAVKEAVDIPVIPKLTPNAPNIGEIAGKAKEAGADAICAINTVGPGYYSVEDNPILTNKVGGMSGRGILPIGLKCVKEIKEAVSLPIIACGGISTAHDIRAYEKNGGNIFGIGSAIAGFGMDGLKKYFSLLLRDLENETNEAEKLLKKDLDMSFEGYKVAENKKLAEDLYLITFDGSIDIKAGQFVFAWIPGTGEKPFSVLNNNPLTLIIHKKGCFTEKLTSLAKGDQVYFRGPYGREIRIPKTKNIIVSGGCGLGALYQIVKESEDAEVFIGGRDKDHIFYVDELKKVAKVHVSTDDGSWGYKGVITELLKEELAKMKGQNLTFYNAGPRIMVEKAVDVEREYAGPERILSSIDYITKCGIGICGSCATEKGKRMCVDGPFFAEEK